MSESLNPNEKQALEAFAAATQGRAREVASALPSTWMPRAQARFAARALGAAALVLLASLAVWLWWSGGRPVAKAPENDRSDLLRISGPTTTAVQEMKSPAPVVDAAKAKRRKPTARVETPAAIDGLESEALALERVVTLLRKERDLSSARSRLDDYFAAFPAPRLKEEADWLSLEIDAAAGRKDDVLARIGRIEVAGHPREFSLRRLRVELLMTDGRCSEAEADLVFLENAADPTLHEAALWHCSVCASDSGSAAFRLAASRYLERFPEGPHADTLRERLLENL